METRFAAESCLQEELDELNIRVSLEPTCASWTGATPLMTLKGGVRWIFQ